MNSPLEWQPGLSSIDRHFAEMLSRKAKVTDFDLIMIFAKLSQTLGNQNSCLPIQDQQLQEKLCELDCITRVDWPEIKFDYQIPTPLVLLCRDGDEEALLYTNRFFQYESRIAANLIQRNRPAFNPSNDYKALEQFFPDGSDPHQKRAALLAASRQLAIISGGPGTGKTSTVVRILATLLEQNQDLRIKLAAPTGKAAMRLSESIQLAANGLGLAEISFAESISTLHRLLGVRGDGRSYQYHAANKLPIDVLILDEASMIDLMMFDRVLEALEDSTRLIILGDPAQLPSVDSGAVLANITAQGECYSTTFNELLAETPGLTPFAHTSNHPLADAHCALVTSFRFQDDEPIGLLAAQLRIEEQSDSTQPTSSEQVEWVAKFDQASLITDMSRLYQQFLECCKATDISADELLDEFDRARLLTPIREGELGVNQLNAAFESKHYPDTDSYYHGKPVMIMRNHYALRLFNGDIGICVKRSKNLEVAFRNTAGEIEYYLPSRLPQHEVCYAMTIHKSQGSEFDSVTLVLPETEQEEFISRELIYTGVTRSREHLKIFSQQNILNAPKQRRITGLSLRLSPRDNLLVPTSETPTQDANNQLDLF